MTYQINMLPKATEDLARLDKSVAQRVLNRIKWLSENFDNLIPEALAGDFRGLFKFRAGSYRVLYSANEREGILVIHSIGHRREVYKTR